MDLKKSTQFLEEVFGMCVIRHEENAAACAITCNGKFNRPWSKTMVRSSHFLVPNHSSPRKSSWFQSRLKNTNKHFRKSTS